MQLNKASDERRSRTGLSADLQIYSRGLNFGARSIYLTIIMNILKHLNQLTAMFGVITFFILWVRRFVQKKELDLEGLLGATLAASSVPTSFVLLFCAFKPSIIQHLEGVNIHIAVAGLILLFLSYRTFYKEWK